MQASSSGFEANQRQVPALTSIWVKTSSRRAQNRRALSAYGTARPAIDYIRCGYIYHGCMSKIGPTVPLTPAVFHVLLALFGRERHGYDIMQQVKSDSRGVVKMAPGTLFGSLDRMIEAGLVAKGNTQDPRRIYYEHPPLRRTTGPTGMLTDSLRLLGTDRPQSRISCAMRCAVPGPQNTFACER
jgi:hypothetical protein